MPDQQQADTQQDAHQELIAKGKALGLKQAANMKPETLIKKIEEIETRAKAKEQSSNAHADIERINAESIPVQVDVVDFGAKFLKSIGFDFEWLGPIANQYGIERFEYIHKFRAFRVYKNGVHVDWIDVNEVGLLNGKRHLCEILLRHTPVDKSRRLFDFHWRG